MHHVPHTGDLPNTVFTTAQSSVMITPHNYFYGDISRHSSQMIRVNYDDEGATDVETFGQQMAMGKVDMEQIAWDPYTYKGDESTRKFPFEVSLSTLRKFGADFRPLEMAKVGRATTNDCAVLMNSR